MYPVLFQVFGIPIFSYSIFLMLSLLSGLFFAYHFLKREGLSWSILFDHLIFLFLFILVFTRIAHIILDFTRYRESFWQIFNIFDGGFFLWGTLIALYLVIRFLLVAEKQNIKKWFDILTPAFSLGLLVFFLGSFFGKGGKGSPTDFFLGVVFEGPEVAFSGVPVHPLNLYLVFIMLILTFFAWYFVWKRKLWKIPKGVVFFGSLSFYCLFRILLEPLYIIKDYIVSGYNVNLLVSWVFFVLALSNLSLILYHEFYSKHRPPSKVSRRTPRRTYSRPGDEISR